MSVHNNAQVCTYSRSILCGNPKPKSRQQTVFRTHTSPPQSLVHASKIKILLREFRWKRQMVGEYPVYRKSGGDSGRVLCAIHCALRRQSSVRICLIQFPFRGNAVYRSLLLSKAVSFSLCDGYNFMDLSFISCPSLFNTFYRSDQNVVCGGSLF